MQTYPQGSLNSSTQESSSSQQSALTPAPVLIVFVDSSKYITESSLELQQFPFVEI